MIIAELMGVFLVGYGIWFAGEGFKRLYNGLTDWWRPVKGKRRYPYPASGILLGVCFSTMGLVFALNSLWAHARSLLWVGGGLFVLVLFIGVAQPRFLHPKWYAQLEDRVGKQNMLQLKRAAYAVDDQEWLEIVSSESFFNAWVNQAMPKRQRATGRGYQKSDE